MSCPIMPSQWFISLNTMTLNWWLYNGCLASRGIVLSIYSAIPTADHWYHIHSKIWQTERQYHRLTVQADCVRSQCHGEHGHMCHALNTGTWTGDGWQCVQVVSVIVRWYEGPELSDCHCWLVTSHAISCTTFDITWHIRLSWIIFSQQIHVTSRH